MLVCGGFLCKITFPNEIEIGLILFLKTDLHWTSNVHCFFSTMDWNLNKIIQGKNF